MRARVGFFDQKGTSRLVPITFSHKQPNLAFASKQGSLFVTTISQTPTPERGTRIITITPTDEAGTALAFGSLITPTWSLTDRKGNVINSRSGVALTALYVVLTNLDLVLMTDDLWRVVTIEATYNSATYGNGLYLKDQYEFPIAPLYKVS